MDVKTLTLKQGYPKHLGQLADAPEQLFLRGSFDFNKQTLAIVGTRKPSTYGCTVTSQIVNSLKGYDINIVSGLALGTDANAHQAALDSGLQTLAVLPCGIGTIYPKSNYQLGQHILEQGGAFLSEYSGQENPRKEHFIARNRLIAALSDAVLIPEAAARSGSLHTANFALDLGIEVLAVPGQINSELSVGTNSLIKTGARMVTSGLDVLEALGLSPNTPKQEKLVFASKEEESIYQALKQKAMSIDELQAKTELESSELQHTLTMLELDNTVRCTAGVWSIS